MQSHFDRALLPPPQAFYQTELGKLSRPSRGWARTICPFHGGTNKTAFSINLQGGGFFCHNCGVHGGDIVDFVMQRDNLDFKRAARHFGAWRDEMTPAERTELRRLQAERQRQRDEQAAQKELERQQLLALRDEIHLHTRLMREISQQLRHDPENDSLWASLQLAWQSSEIAERYYMQMAGLDYEK